MRRKGDGSVVLAQTLIDAQRYLHRRAALETFAIALSIGVIVGVGTWGVAIYFTHLVAH